MYNVTIVIPLYNLDELRKRNFNFLFKKIKELNCNIILAEQHKEFNYSKKISEKIIHQYVKINSDVFHKSKLLNECANNVKTEYIWFMDADVFLPYNHILDCIIDQNVIKPFKYCIYLDEYDTNNFITNKELQIKDTPKKVLKKFGALSFIIKKTCFKKIKFDEKYIGYGFEDLDIAERILNLYNVHMLDNVIGLHLYHKIQQENPKNFEIFKSLF